MRGTATSLVIFLSLIASARAIGEDTIHACVDPKGRVRIVTDPSDCGKNESPNFWNKIGAPGVIDPSKVIVVEKPLSPVVLCPEGSFPISGGAACPINWNIHVSMPHFEGPDLIGWNAMCSSRENGDLRVPDVTSAVCIER